MHALSPRPDPRFMPLRDPHVSDFVLDYADMHGLVTDLVVPGHTSMSAMSAMETSGELIRHSYYRYQFATNAVTHSLFALEQVLAQRLDMDEPLPVLVERAAGAGLCGDGNHVLTKRREICGSSWAAATPRGTGPPRIPLPRTGTR
ncbi:hypothetical protein ACFYZ9_19010 [Streptomyces sp. NPDC001691]|uniref:hypothetical protein n=1 Tax=Streptomyces sp. NPDC001691 TaxID=3364600 RepID=UPI0036C7A0CE